MYAEGRGVPDDDREAVKWYRKGAEQGTARLNSTWASCMVGAREYPRTRGGEVVPEAAEQGEAGAQTALGTMYLGGKGVAKDHREAVKWLSRAAEQGD